MTREQSMWYCAGMWQAIHTVESGEGTEIAKFVAALIGRAYGISFAEAMEANKQVKAIVEDGQWQAAIARKIGMPGA
jgi:hypothetical protein